MDELSNLRHAIFQFQRCYFNKDRSEKPVMTFMDISFLLFLTGLLLIFYIVPLRARWVVLLAGSICFYYLACREALPILFSTILISYLLSRLIYSFRENTVSRRRLILAGGILVIACPLFLIKEGNYILLRLNMNTMSLIVPLGISFYTMQIISYLVDIYKGKAAPEKNILRYALYISYFPQIIQGPIPRFGELSEQLKINNKLDETMFVKGFQLILWGWFLKLVIADKAGIIVDTVYSNTDIYQGMYVLVAGILYSIQLYADFQACVCMARGISELFGIELSENFNHPYFSQSVSEFWRRWHISLSAWLRDYVYIPLGGSRKGKIRRYANLMITFIISGMWHGAGSKYIFWGLLHAAYQITGDIMKPIRQKICELLKLKPDDKLLAVMRTFSTFFWVMLAWIIFRADSLREGISMIVSIFTTWNPWILFNDSLFSLGLSWKECAVLLGAILLLILISHYQEMGNSVREKILEQNIVTRWIIYIALIVAIVIFGTYGYGFEAKDFIYGGF